MMNIKTSIWLNLNEDIRQLTDFNIEVTMMTKLTSIYLTSVRINLNPCPLIHILTSLLTLIELEML